MLAKTAGVRHLVVLINKMDDPTVEWSEERYEECKTKLTPFLKKVGFNPKTGNSTSVAQTGQREMCVRSLLNPSSVHTEYNLT